MELIWPNLLLELDHLEPAGQAHVPVSSECFQGWRLPRSLSGPPLPVLGHLHCTPSASQRPAAFQSVPTAPCYATGHHGMEPGHILSAPPLLTLMSSGKLSRSPLPPHLRAQRGRPQLLRPLKAERSRPDRPEVAAAGPRCCSVPSPPEQPRAHGGTERSDGPRARPGHAASGTRPGPPSPRRQRWPGARRRRRLGKRLYTGRHSSRQGKRRANAARPLPPQTLTRGAASLPGARSPPHHVPAAANRGAPRPRPGPAPQRRRLTPGALGEPLLPELLRAGAAATAAFPWQILVLTQR